MNVYKHSIEMLYGMLSWLGPRKHVLDGSPDSPTGNGNFEGKWGGPFQSKGLSAVSCAKVAEPIEMQFGMRSPVGPRKHVLNGGTHRHNVANMTQPSMCSCDKEKRRREEEKRGEGR